MSEEYYDEKTLDKVADVLRKNGYLPDDIPGVISDFQNAGILFRERGQEFTNLELSQYELEQAVDVALGAASSCWDNLEGAGVFQSERCADIGQQLKERIRRSSPIYG